MVVETKSPEQYTEIKAGGGVKGLLGIAASKIQLFDNKRVIVKIKKGESIALLDNDNFYELSRDSRGRHNLRNLKNSKVEKEI
jgi:hypothetical protein